MTRHAHEEGSISAKPRSSPLTFFNFTQVCREIRKEYRPLYFAKTEFHVSVEELPDYVNTFISPPGSEPSSAVGKIVLMDMVGRKHDPRRNSVTDRDRYVKGQREPLNLDLLDLIHLEKVSENLSIRSYHKDFQYCFARYILDPFLDSKNTPKLHAYLDEAVIRVQLLVKKTRGHVIQLDIKKDFCKEWMLTPTSAMTNYSHYIQKREETRRELNNWAQELGLTDTKYHFAYLFFKVEDTYQAEIGTMF
ncbi:hypothetical protein J1614_003322 [Plenodomus biglobosus]|nr:hypothetical protein J1614_003322 [Plenodomus biglobosus]